MFYFLCLDCFMILLIFAFLMICVSVLKPNNSCNLSVNSVLVYAGIYPYPSIAQTFIFLSVSRICSTVYSFFNFDSNIRYISNAIKHIRKCACIQSSLRTYIGRASKSVFMILKHSSICHLRLLIAII